MDQKALIMADIPPYRFVFGLHHSDYKDDAEYTYWFPFTDETQIDLINKMNDEEDDVLGKSEELEEFGVHDFATSGDYELIGYHSYEIEYHNWLMVVNEWRNFFISKGIACGEIVMMPSADYETQFGS